MSQFTVPVVRVGKVEKHPNADTLSLTEAEGCPCIIRTGDLQEGDLAVYVPIESVIAEDSPAGKAMSFLKFKGGKHRVKASKLRGIFSMGVLMPVGAFDGVAQDLLVADGHPQVGTDLAATLGIEKYEEPEDEIPGKHPQSGIGYSQKYSDCDVDPGLMPKYDMESYRKFKSIFNFPVTGDDSAPPEAMEVVVTEKIHGTNARFIHDGERLWIGTHRTWRKVEGESTWHKIAAALGLDIKLARAPKLGLFGEIYGSVQDLTYGAQPGELHFAVFDAWDATKMRYLDWDQTVEVARDLGLVTVPVLYRGPMNAAIIEPLADGKTTIGGDNIREGIVIKPTVERWNRYTGRTIAKLVSEAYLLRKDGTERH